MVSHAVAASEYTISIDDRTMAWKGSDQLFGNGVIYLATEAGAEEQRAVTDSSVPPTKSPLPIFVALAALGFCSVLAIRERKD